MNESFIDLVRRMRTAQRQYFATRGTAQLHAATRLEREVDRALEHPWVPVQSALLPDTGEGDPRDDLG